MRPLPGSRDAPSSVRPLPSDPRIVSRFGFGTSALMSRVNRSDSLRLLHTAFEHGIRHFDTARSYGFGEAEVALGDFLQGRRDLVTVTTKIGILPPRPSTGMSMMKRAARGLLAAIPALRPVVRLAAGGLVRAGHFDPASMQRSFELSLRQLRTDHVDFLLLHEPTAEAILSEEPLQFLERMQREGKALSYGIAAEQEVVIQALRGRPEYMQVAQFPNSIFQPCSPWLRAHRPAAVFTHSSIGTAGAELRESFTKDPHLQRRWTDGLALDVATPGLLESLFLQYGLRSFPGAVVLFTSISTDHIRQNAAVLGTAASAERLQQLEHLVRSWRRKRRRG